MKERPILFSAPMVRALLDGRKTQTRRVVKPQPVYEDAGGCFLAWQFAKRGGGVLLWPNGSAEVVKSCPYGQPGDRLWVRERHCFLDVTKSALSQFPLGPQNGNAVGPDVWNVCVEYSDGTEDELRAEGEKPRQTRARGELGWRPGIFMPRWASRITLEIVEIRAERLQEISEEDAKAEGMLFNGTYYQGGPHAVSGSKVFALATQAYRDLWDSINAKRALWASNLWVWVLTFKRLP